MVQNRQQTHDWTLIGSGANGLGIQKWIINYEKLFDLILRFSGATRTFIRGEAGGGGRRGFFKINKIRNTGCVTKHDNYITGEWKYDC